MSMFSENLKKYRQMANLSQEALGKKIGVTGVTIMRYEKGVREPKIETMKKLANALNIPLSKLIDINSPTMSNVAKKFISSKTPEEIEHYGDIMDEVIMSSPIGSTINDYQAAKMELDSLRLEMICLCYDSLNEQNRNLLYNYARQLLEDTQEFKDAISKNTD